MKSLLLIFKYLNYLINSKNEHAIQGPFIFKFVTKVLYKKKNDENCNRINTLRNKLCNSEETIEITDFGAGSRINNCKSRQIKDIARNSAKNSKFGKLLYRVVRFYQPENIIELGTSLGISACYLAKGNPNGNVFTFEGCPETIKIAKRNFEELKIKNIEAIVGDFDLTLKKRLKEISSIDLAFIDGNHKELATISYFEECLKYTNNNTIFVFDDIHWSEGMENAWKYIQEHPKTTVTIDLFFVGLVFLKSELSKEHFTIRF